MSTTNICFYGETWKIIPKLSSITNLICFSVLNYVWAMSWQNLFLRYANNKGADQPAHPCNLNSTFVVCCLDSTIPILAKSKISRLLLVSEAGQASLSLTRSQILKKGFLLTRLKWQYMVHNNKVWNTAWFRVVPQLGNWDSFPFINYVSWSKSLDTHYKTCCILIVENKWLLKPNVETIY